MGITKYLRPVRKRLPLRNRRADAARDSLQRAGSATKLAARAGLAALACVALVSFAAPAQAQTQTTLVSNYASRHATETLTVGDTSEPRGSYRIGLVDDSDTGSGLSGWQLEDRRDQDGNGDWSDGGARSAAMEVAGSIVNNAPVFSDATLSRSVEANAPAGRNVGAAIPAAADADNDTLVYSLEGADAASFEFDAASRRIRTRAGVTYGGKGKTSYSVTVQADDGWGGTDRVAVTIAVANMQEVAPREKPPKMDKPTVRPTAGSHTSLTVSWTAPDNVQPPITHYDTNGDHGPGGTDWTRGNFGVTGTSTTLTGLPRADREYRVRLRAVNGPADDDGPWVASDWTFTGNPPLHVPSTTEVPADWPLKPDWARGGRQIPPAVRDRGEILTV